MNAPIPLHLLKDQSTTLVESLPPTLRDSYDQLLSCFNVPGGQYGIARAVHTAALSYMAFCKDAPTYSQFRATNCADVSRVAEALRLIASVNPVSPDMVRRVEKDRYTPWALLLRLQPHCTPVMVALGGAIALAMETKTKVHKSFCKALLADAENWSDIDASAPPDEDWLTDERFGARWKAAETKNWQSLGRLLAPQGFDIGAPPEVKSLKGALISKARFADLPHIECQVNRDHLGVEELRSVMGTLKHRVREDRCDEALLHCFRVLFGCPPDLLKEIPVCRDPMEIGMDLALIDLSGGCMRFNLDAYFEHRAKVSPTSTAQFLPACTEIRTPLPAFLIEALQARWISRTQARPSPDTAFPVEVLSVKLGDLLTADEEPASSHATATQGVLAADELQGEPREPLKVTNHRRPLQDGLGTFALTLARACKSLPVQAVRHKVPKGIVAALTWDFGLVNEARHYYTHVRATQVIETYGRFLSEMGWESAEATTIGVADYGSRITLAPEAVISVFREIDFDLEHSPKGPRMGLESLIQLHNAMARSCVARVSFCLGLRQAAPYCLTANRVTTEAGYLIVKDKQRQDDRTDRPVPLTPLVIETIRMWNAHCESLLQRLMNMAIRSSADSSSAEPALSPTNSTSANRIQAVIRHLQAIRSQRPVDLFFQIGDTAVIPIGSREVWGTLPAQLSCPPNVGRHFWSSELLALGAPSMCIDLFLRHHASGYEFNDAMQPVPIASLLCKVSDLQGSVLRKLNILAPVGLSRGQS